MNILDNIKNFAADKTPVGRMQTKDENFAEATKNSIKEISSDIKDAAGSIFDGISDGIDSAKEKIDDLKHIFSGDNNILQQFIDESLDENSILD